MPIITVEIIPQEYENKAEIAKIFTDELERITGINKGAISVVFHELPAENVAKGGVMLPEILKNMK